MAALLLYSHKCAHCKDLLEYIDTNEKLKSIIQLQNIHTNGIPEEYRKKISRMPTMLTKNNKILVGSEIKQWLESLLPSDISNCPIGDGCNIAYGIDGESTDDSFFNLDMYGQSLQPAMTKELELKINRNVGEAFNTYKD
jgi:hypothetical protein